MAFIGNTNLTQSFAPAIDTFNGDASTVAFTLSRPVISVAQIQVVVENVPQSPNSAFSVSGNTLTFTSAPPSGSSNIYVYYVTTNSQVVGVSQGSIGIDELTASGTPSAATFLRGDNTWASAAGFPSGTVMLFVQTSAPTGWTKSTAHNNKALRIVSGTASSGGSVDFTTAFGTPAVSGSVGATTLNTTQIPSHSHTVPSLASGLGCSFSNAAGSPGNGATAGTGATGGGGSHTHSLSGATTTINVAYVDAIIATKD
jgi:hypothetical protein